MIYPRQIKRELGAKIIYDAICPVASKAFMDLIRMKRKLWHYGSRGYRQFIDILRKCFEDKEDIASMVEGDNLELLAEKVMELIMEVYL